MTTLTCLRCGHTWQPRINKRPIQCPVCKSPQWDKPRKTVYEMVKSGDLQKALNK